MFRGSTLLNIPQVGMKPSDIKDLEDAPLVHSYGLILKQNEKTITLIADLIPSDNTFGRGTTIPKGMIKESSRHSSIPTNES